MPIFNKSNTVRLDRAQTGTFGEILVAENYPIFTMDFLYGIVKDRTIENKHNGGTVSAASSMGCVTTGNTSGALAALTTQRNLIYRPGQGAICRFTAKFDEPTAASTQLAGLSNGQDGLMVGYLGGTAFSVLHQHHGKFPIWQIDVDTASSNTEDVTVAFGSGNTVDVGVTNTGNANETANELALISSSSVGGANWEFHAVSSTVYVIRTRASQYSGIPTTSGTSLAASTEIVVTGAAPTNDIIRQSDFNKDKLVPASNRQQDFDPTKLNVYQIGFQYLGGGNIEFRVEDPGTGDLEPFHTIEYAGNNSAPSLGNPSLPFSLAVNALAANQDVTAKTASVGMYSQGPRTLITNRFAVDNIVNNVSAAALKNIVSIKGGPTFLNKLNLAEAILHRLTMSGEASTAKLVLVEMWVDTNVGTDAVWQWVDKERSCMLVDYNATTFSGGHMIDSFALPRSYATEIDLTDSIGELYLKRGETITIAATIDSGGTSDVACGISWLENH